MIKIVTIILISISLFSFISVDFNRNDSVSASISSKKFKLKIKTKGNSIIGLQIEARNCDDAKVKVSRRYPGCEFLSCEEV
jgi:hypothetical protein